jgi:hypothetical protein
VVFESQLGAIVDTLGQLHRDKIFVEMM